VSTSLETPCIFVVTLNTPVLGEVVTIQMKPIREQRIQYMAMHYILKCVYYFQYLELLLRHLYPYYVGSSLALVLAYGTRRGSDVFSFCACSMQFARAV
jgi:hypothetical protein